VLPGPRGEASTNFKERPFALVLHIDTQLQSQIGAACMLYRNTRMTDLSKETDEPRLDAVYREEPVGRSTAWHSDAYMQTFKQMRSEGRFAG
jgi:hypothetical protein